MRSRRQLRVGPRLTPSGSWGGWGAVGTAAVLGGGVYLLTRQKTEHHPSSDAGATLIEAMLRSLARFFALLAITVALVGSGARSAGR